MSVVALAGERQGRMPFAAWRTRRAGRRGTRSGRRCARDAVEAVNVLADVLAGAGPVPTARLAEVQRRRARWIRLVQRLQAGLQRMLVVPALEAGCFVPPMQGSQ